MAIYFHGNYGLHRGRMATLLGRMRREPSETNRELGAFFGYSASYASRYRSWLHKCGLILQGSPLQMTGEGEEIVRRDKGLRTIETQRFMHRQLVTPPRRAQMWHEFYHLFLAEHEFFTGRELLEFLTRRLSLHSEEHFGPGSAMTRTVRRKILECYLDAEALGELGVIVAEGGGYRRGFERKNRRECRKTSHPTPGS